MMLCVIPVFAEENVALPTNCVDDPVYYLNLNDKQQINDNIERLRGKYNDGFDISIFVRQNIISMTSEEYLNKLTGNAKQDVPGIVIFFNSDEQCAYIGQYSNQSGEILLTTADISDIKTNELNKEFTDKTLLMDAINNEILPIIDQQIQKENSDYKTFLISEQNNVIEEQKKQIAHENQQLFIEKLQLVLSLIVFAGIIMLTIFLICYFRKRKEQKQVQLEELELQKLEKIEQIEDILYQTKFRKEQFNCMNALFGNDEKYSIIHCSKNIMANFRYDDMKMQYLTKYFDLVINDETVDRINKLLECYEAAKTGLIEKYAEVPALTPWDWPVKICDYTSPSGTVHESSQFFVDEQGLLFIKKQAQALLNKQSSKKIQRQLMTPELSEAIIRRDNWTCQKCGNSVFKEPNLLLEVDHIIPVSKGGKTEPNNLQTLCWKCNREKSDKLDD